MKASLLLLPALLGALGVFAASDIAAEVKYFYAKDGTIIGRAVNGVRSDFEYDAKGQLLTVRDAKTGELREKYTYDVFVMLIHNASVPFCGNDSCQNESAA